MAKKFIGLLPHGYQPPWQYPFKLNEIVDECYWPFFNWVARHPEPMLTININYSLLELLEINGHSRLTDKIRRAVQLGLVELTGSAAFHPILTMISEKETRRQIRLNEDGIKRILGIDYRKGFFPPEMAINSSVARLIKFSGYQWTITDDPPFVAKYGHALYNVIPTLNNLPILLRSNHWSEILARKKYRTESDFINAFREGLKTWFAGNDGYIILSLDVETFGHHEKGYMDFLMNICQELHGNDDWKLVPISEIVANFPKQEMDISPGSWATSGDYYRQGIYFPLWNHPQNRCHQLLWDLVYTLLEVVGDEETPAREIMDRALNSCQFWLLSSEHWDPDNAFKTFDFYNQLMEQLNLTSETRNKLYLIINKLEQETGKKLIRTI